WYVVKGCCERAGLEHIAPHDLRRTCAKLCHVSGGELEQIQFLLGHASVQTTERYLGCKQNLREPVNDRFTLQTELQDQAPPSESGQTAGRATVEMPSERGIECGHGGSEHDRRVGHFRSGQVPKPLRPDVVEIRRGRCSQGLRRCSEPGTERT